MKTKILMLITCSLAFILSCEKDGNLIRVSGLKSSELMSSESNVVLTKETSSSNVLAITWSKSDLTISDKSMGIPGSVPLEILEASASENFENATEITPQGNTYAFTGVSLNTLAKNLGFAAGESTPLYFRVRSALGGNTEPLYSNVISVNVTCFSIDMSIGFIMNTDMEDTGFKLYSPGSDGVYFGFTGETAWYNWYFLEGDGTIWGNLGVDGNAFVLSSDESTHWNFWYPGQSGCFYTTLSTANEEWTATYIPSLTISGDIDATMTFDRQTVKWYASFTTTADNATIKVTGENTKLYNVSTSTDDAAAITKSIGFIPNSDSTISFEWNNASATNITISKAGDYTLSLMLSDPTKWTFRVSPGKTVVVEPISKFLYLPGIDDGISGSWTFDNYLKLISEDDSTFAGSILVNSLWGYQMGLTSGDWTNVYQMGSSAGTLAFKSGTNITAPDPGLYLIQADLKNLTYSHIPITSLSYAGLNDDWNMVAMDETEVPGVYSSTVTINSVSPWGCKLYLNGGWDYFYGGADGVLDFKGTGIIDDATIGTGTFDLISDIRNNSYVFLGNEVYIGGLNDVWDFTSVVLTKSSIGVYTGTATISTPSTWGIKIYLDQSWNRFFGGTFGEMKYLGTNITDDQGLAGGTYNVTVDFINNTCTFGAKK
jgi:starch-binding outer membrane protein SusE/F